MSNRNAADRLLDYMSGYARGARDAYENALQMALDDGAPDSMRSALERYVERCTGKQENSDGR